MSLIKISNISDLKIMYLTTSIGFKAFEFLDKFGLYDNVILKINKKNNIMTVNKHFYNLLITKYGGTSQLNYDSRTHYNLILNEIIYDNIDNFNDIFKEFKKVIINYKKSEYIIDELNSNTLMVLINKGDLKDYYSLIFLGVPFALKIKDKKIMMQKIYDFLVNFTKDYNQILATIVCGLFVNYSLNRIGPMIWLPEMFKDLDEMNDKFSKIELEKFTDYFRNYYELNFVNEVFVEKESHLLIEARNLYFLENHCYRNNDFFTEKPEEQILFVYDSFIRSTNNWEKIILYGMMNFNDNINISLILGVLYELNYSSSYINKNLIKRFSL